MHIAVHSMTALPFLATGQYATALGCVLPDVAWIVNEYRFHTSTWYDWEEWSKRYLTERQCIAYRMTHSVLIVTAVCAFFNAWSLWSGCMLHILLDLPTHRGLMQQQPFYPISKWRWPWLIK